MTAADEGLAALGVRMASAGQASAHGTGVALGGRGLLILGPSGAGKSGTAAALVAQGARLVADDLVRLEAGPDGITMLPPRPSDDAGAPIELRGIGLAWAPAAGPATLHGLLWLGPSRARLPAPEHVALLGHAVPIARHPAHRDLPGKVALWLAGLP